MKETNPKTANNKPINDFLCQNATQKPNGGLDPKTAEALVLGTTEEVLELKLEQELAQCFEQKTRSEALRSQVMEDFSQVPESKVFAKTTFYKLFNRKNSREFVIDGVMLEGRIGLDSSLYKKIKSRAVSTFSVGDSIVKFYKSIGG